MSTEKMGETTQTNPVGERETGVLPADQKIQEYAASREALNESGGEAIAEYRQTVEEMQAVESELRATMDKIDVLQTQYVQLRAKAQAAIEKSSESNKKSLELTSLILGQYIVGKSQAVAGAVD